MGDGTDPSRTDRQHPDSFIFQRLDEIGRPDPARRDADHHDVGVNTFHIDLETLDLAHTLGDPPRGGVVQGQPVDVVLEGVDTSRGPSPSEASTIARFMAGEGRVTVSLRRS